MKKLIVLALLMAVILLVAALVHAQSPATDLKPTFINPTPTPGLYVNGWPAFTVSYPKDWVEVPLTGPGGVFMAAASRPGTYPSPVFTIAVYKSPFPLEEWAKNFMPVWVNIFTDIKVLSDKPSQLKDGTPAREVEVEFVPKIDITGSSMKNAPKHNGLLFATKKDMTWVSIWMSNDKGKIGEDPDLKRVAYSLAFQPDREKPVQVPPDVRAFLDMWCADVVSHDVKTIMAHFSDRFRYSGASKPYYEQIFRNDPASPIQRGVTSCEATVTVFEPHGDNAYVDGFISEKAKGDTNALKAPMEFQQIINEHGQWKWFGNQK
jgi:hypothetical protein